MIIEYDETYINFAHCLALESKEATKVGCIIVGLYHEVLGMGYNYKSIFGNIIHAEKAALGLFSWLTSFSQDEWITAYITKATCLDCAKRLVRCGVDRLVMPEPYEFHSVTGERSKWYASQMEALKYLKTSGVTVDLLKMQYMGNVA